MATTAKLKLGEYLIYDVLSLKGFGTKYDATSMKLFSQIGQNVFLENGVISPRPGSELDGIVGGLQLPIKSQWTFNKRGLNSNALQLRSYGTVLEYWNPATLSWTLLKDNFAAGKIFGHDTQNNSSDNVGYTWFCNGVDDVYRWSGSYSKVLIADDINHLLTIDDTHTSAELLFTASGQLRVNGKLVSYSSILTTGGKLHSLTSPVATSTIVIQGVTLKFVNVLNNPGDILLTGNDTDAVNNLLAFIQSPGVNTAVSRALTVPADIATIANLNASIDPLQSYYDLNISTKDNSALTISGVPSPMVYTATYSKTFAGVSSLAGINPGDPIAQTPLDVSTAPKGNILMVDNTALYIAGVIGNENILYRSHIDDAATWTFSSPRLAGEGFAIGVTEGGTAITGMMKDEKVIYIAKGSLLKTLEYTSTSDATTSDIPILKPLKTYDGKSELVGIVNQNCIFSNGNGLFFVNNRNEVNNLTRFEYIDYPQIQPISDLIRPTVLAGVFDEASGIVFNQKAYLAYKQSTSSEQNDTVIVYDIIRQAWEDPIVGWYVNDWNVFQGELHWGSSLDNTSYKQVKDKTDNLEAFTALWRSWMETFDTPHLQKQSGGVYVEGYLSPTMNKDNPLIIDILYDENGRTGTLRYLVYTDNGGIIFSSPSFNPFGVNKFGYERFGSNADQGNFSRFRAILPLKSDVEFYTVQIQFSSLGKASDWEVVRFGFRLDNICDEDINIQLPINT